MEDGRRMLIGFLLIFIVMIIFQFYTISKRRAEPSRPEKSTVQEEELRESKELIDEKSRKEIDDTEKKISALLSNADTLNKDIGKNDIIIETNLMKVYLSTVGGVIDSVFLKDYNVVFSPLNSKSNLLSTTMLKGREKISLEKIPFVPKISEFTGEKKLIFSYNYDSIKIQKEYIFRDNSYLIDITCLPEREYFYKISVFDTEEEFPREARYSGAVYSMSRKPNTVGKGDLFKGENKEISGTIDWVGYKTKYFFIGIIPDDYVTDFTLQKSPDSPVISIRTDPYTAIYIGPLNYGILSSVKEGLEDAIYFGWAFIRPISKVIYHFMKFLNKFIHNYGAVIIVFAIVMILILSPITLTSFRSMHKMQKIQPKMQEIRERFKDDPQRMNKEMMELYREAGVNPFSSCLPLFLQFPIFFALYSVLNSSIELKGASFILWIQDLSMKDPYYILPILMGASMFLQQRFLSTAQQSDQQRIFSFIMPAIITFVFLSFPSGLALYWLTYNILMIFVQAYIRRQG